MYAVHAREPARQEMFQYHASDIVRAIVGPFFLRLGHLLAGMEFSLPLPANKAIFAAQTSVAN